MNIIFPGKSDFKSHRILDEIIDRFDAAVQLVDCHSHKEAIEMLLPLSEQDCYYPAFVELYFLFKSCTFDYAKAAMVKSKIKEYFSQIQTMAEKIPHPRHGH